MDAATLRLSAGSSPRRLLVRALLLSLSLATMAVGCKDAGPSTGPNGTTATGRATITGIVQDTLNQPVANAYVEVVGEQPVVSSLTNASGQYQLTIQAPAPRTVTIRAISGDLRDSITVANVGGNDTNRTAVPLRVRRRNGVNEGRAESGPAASLVLVSQNVATIGVRGTGSNETAQFVFEARDPQGNPVDSIHAATVRFTLRGGPGGGEQLDPPTRVTSNGRVIATVNSGTKAGVVQLLAEASVVETGKTINAIPVSLTIHGGPPEQRHYAIVPSRLNFPGYNIFGLNEVITAQVGDRYSNPTRVGTAVYFSSSAGIIQGSALTDADGFARVRLFSGPPVPSQPLTKIPVGYPSYLLGRPGYALVVGSTVDENQRTILDSTVVLFSGLSFISDVRITAPSVLTGQDSVLTRIDVPYGGQNTITFRVTDQQGNPLASGTSVNVAVEGEGAKVAGKTAYAMPDTQDPRFTYFSFNIQDGELAEGPNGSVGNFKVPAPVTVTIKVDGPNGPAELSLSGRVD